MLLGFQSYFNQQLNEEATAGGGILHLEHPADLHFDGEQGTAHALKTLRGVVSGRTPITRKVDDKTSVKLKVDMDGRVGAGYKGASSPYAYSDADVDTHYKDKPYAGALKAIIANAKKVLPNRVGEWQGGFLSTPETRQTDGNSISHTPNTIKYSIPRRSPEGKKLAQSKVSMVVHTELTGPGREPTPVLNTSEFREHPDVHLMSHVVPESEKAVLPEHAKKANQHLDAAEALLDGHDHSHMAGHETTMRQYINSLVETGAEANAKGYAKFLKGYHDKKIEKLKTAKGKAGKIAARDAALANVKGNAKAFDRSFKIHHHLQQATNALARSLGQTAHGGYEHTFADSDVKTGPEGFVAKEADGIPLKVVDRSPEGFAAANRARSARFKKPTVQESVISGIVKAIKTYSKPAAETVKKVQPVEKVQSGVARASTEKTPAAIINISQNKKLKEGVADKLIRKGYNFLRSTPKPTVQYPTPEHEKAAKAATDYLKRRERHKELLDKRKTKIDAIDATNDAIRMDTVTLPDFNAKGVNTLMRRGLTTQIRDIAGSDDANLDNIRRDANTAANTVVTGLKTAEKKIDQYDQKIRQNVRDFILGR